MELTIKTKDKGIFGIRGVTRIKSYNQSPYLVIHSKNREDLIVLQKHFIKVGVVGVSIPKHEIDEVIVESLE